MNSSLFSICFQTDTSLTTDTTEDTDLTPTHSSGASGNGTPNKDIFTISTLLDTNIELISNDRIKYLIEEYKINLPHINLWFFDINTNIDTDFEKYVCVILFINDVYGIHYVCNTDHYSIRQLKVYILDNVIPNYKLYKKNDNDKNDGEDKINDYKFNLLINTFDFLGKTKSSVYETISI